MCGCLGGCVGLASLLLTCLNGGGGASVCARECGEKRDEVCAPNEDDDGGDVNDDGREQEQEQVRCATCVAPRCEMREMVPRVQTDLSSVRYLTQVPIVHHSSFVIRRHRCTPLHTHYTLHAVLSYPSPFLVFVPLSPSDIPFYLTGLIWSGLRILTDFKWEQDMERQIQPHRRRRVHRG